MSGGPDTSVIVVPREAKARWVRQSQAVGMKLADWLVEAVDRAPNRIGQPPCPRCGATVLVSDGPGLWQCAQCGLES